MNQTQPVVVCQQLTRTFRDFWMRARARAVENLTFQIDRGEIFGLLGPNGSGKSTTIKMILGLLRPSSGRIAVFGKPPTDVETKRRIGYLPEESYLYQFLNARETLEYYAKLFELERRKQAEKLEELTGEKREIGFGSQIRSYTLHPQQRAKDHRTDLEIGNVESVLDGDLDAFIRATLLAQAAQLRPKRGGE